MKKIILLLGMFLLCSSMLLAQKTLTGKVTSSEDGSALPGVTIAVKGTSTGTITDLDGNYKITVPAGSNTLVFTFVGMKTQEIEIGSQTSINIALESSSVQLEGMVVVAYGVQKKSDINGAVSQVTAEKLSSGGSKESVDKALSGKISGVRSSSATGNPGSTGEILVRGVGSITANSTPLYVIDGIPIETGNYGTSSMSSNVLSTINTEDIESISVLKDAAASSLYGSRAANGVVVITTKKGAMSKSGEMKTSINFKGSWGISSMAVNAFNMADGKSWVQYCRTGLENYYLNAFKALVPGQANYANQADYLADAKQFSDDNIEYEVKTLDKSTNWKDELFRVGKVQDYQVSMTGGSQKTNFYVGLGYMKNNGIVINSNFERFSNLLSLEHKATDWLKVGLRNNISFANQKGFSDNSSQGGSVAISSPIGQLLSLEPSAPVYNDDGSINHDVSWGNADNPSITFGDKMVKLNNKTLRNLTNADLTIDFTKDLSFKSTLGVDLINNKLFQFWHPESIDGAAYGGYGYYYFLQSDNVTSSNILNYSKTLNKVHNFSALGGFESSRTNFNTIEVANSNYSTGELIELQNGSSPQTASSSKFGNSILSYLGKGEYNYDSKYYISASLRADGSSRLGANERWAPFYAFGASWRINKENFLADTKWIDDLKLRVSYGTNGTLPLDYYGHLGLFNMTGSYNNQGSIYVYQPANPDLTWEKSKNLNIGVDFGFNSKFNISVEYWNKYTSDLLLDVTTSYLSAFGTTIQNSGEMSNKGIDFDFTSYNIDHKNFKWNTNFNLSYLKTTVEKLPFGNDINTGAGIDLFLFSEGEAMYTMYLPKWYGVNPENGLGQFYIDPEKDATEDNLTYYYANAKKGKVGKVLPDVTGGLTNSFKAYGFDLSFLITYQFGGNIYDHFGYFASHDGRRGDGMNVSQYVIDNYWKAPGDNALFPRPSFYVGLGTDRWSSRQIFSSDFIRLKEVSLSYTLPKSLATKMHYNSLSVFVKSSNPLMLWMKEKEYDFDPEVALNGVRTNDIPNLKSLNFGISLNF